MTGTVLLLLLLPACNPVEVADVSAARNWPENSASLSGLIPESLTQRLETEPIMSLRADPDFSPAQLSEEQRVWYDRLWIAIESPEQTPDASAIAASDDEYQYARTLFEYNSALLLALRATGDPRFLDEVDRIAQSMRSNLSDSWCGGRDRLEIGRYRAMRGRDGYLNFRRRVDEDNVHYCRDSSDLEETLMHGHVAMLMYAYHVNRDVESPAGTDYGERADFWLGYLLDHFEPKWRERSGIRFPDMEFIDTKFCHTYSVFLLYHYFIGKRLQDDGLPVANTYLFQAAQMTDELLDTPYRRGRQPGGFTATDTPLGPAVVFAFGSPSSEPDENRLEACPVMYSRYLTAAALQLYFENFYRWDQDLLGRLATGFAHFVIGETEVRDAGEIFAASVVGRDTVAGIPPTSYREPLATHQYALTQFAALAAWEPGDRIREASREVYEVVESDVDEPKRVAIPASFLLLASLQERQSQDVSADSSPIWTPEDLANLRNETTNLGDGQPGEDGTEDADSD